MDYLNALDADGIQSFNAVSLQVLTREENYLVARIVEPDSDCRVAILSQIDFGWLEACCPGILRAFPPDRLGCPTTPAFHHRHPGQSYLLEQAALDRTARDTEAENDWLTVCALRFDCYRYAAEHGLTDQPYDFSEKFVRNASLEADSGYLMAAMAMLQRRLMKEGVDSKTCQAWRIFRLLFLRLCHEPVPDEYRQESFATAWETKYQHHLAEGIQTVKAMHAGTAYEDCPF